MYVDNINIIIPGMQAKNSPEFNKIFLLVDKQVKLVAY